MTTLSTRQCRGRAPIEYDKTSVPVAGEELDQILWRGRQWAVTTYGLECLDGGFAIKKSELIADIRGAGLPFHISKMGCFDMDDFCTAWLIALTLHGVHLLPETVLDAIAKSFPTWTGGGVTRPRPVRKAPADA